MWLMRTGAWLMPTGVGLGLAGMIVTLGAAAIVVAEQRWEQAWAEYSSAAAELAQATSERDSARAASDTRVAAAARDYDVLHQAESVPADLIEPATALDEYASAVSEFVARSGLTLAADGAVSTPSSRVLPATTAGEPASSVTELAVQTVEVLEIAVAVEAQTSELRAELVGIDAAFARAVAALGSVVHAAAAKGASLEYGHAGEDERRALRDAVEALSANGSDDAGPRTQIDRLQNYVDAQRKAFDSHTEALAAEQAAQAAAAEAAARAARATGSSSAGSADYSSQSGRLAPYHLTAARGEVYYTPVFGCAPGEADVVVTERQGSAWGSWGGPVIVPRGGTVTETWEDRQGNRWGVSWVCP